ncbi:glutathione S-transferase family protein [Polaromonas sp.]|uniref:glutathione S-transferase family protein n=1 Tax=Polaromonas sp. TaxID=1869339 RepID=UPI003565FE96
MTSKLVLVSHNLCPYVQRAAIVLAEKGIAFEQINIDLANKPGWFLKISPLGKTPVLLVDDVPIFESAAICEYLDETALPRLHPADPLQRAQHRGWMEFGSSVLNVIGAFYNASDDAALDEKAAELRRRFDQIESELGTGPYFEGSRFSMVDAVFGPIFRYFDVFESFGDFKFFTDTPKIVAWRQALAARPSVQGAAHSDYIALLREFLVRRNSAISRRVERHP